MTYVPGSSAVGTAPRRAATAAVESLHVHGQDRAAKDAHLFKSWKFHSMVPDSDRQFGPRQAEERDPRITRVGHVLLATAIKSWKFRSMATRNARA